MSRCAPRKVNERMEEEDEGCGVGRGVPHKRLAQSESGVDGGDDVVAVWV